ncbi:MAG TPA: radical SAM protein [Kiritimatiellia bacterium]|nr:radical SAM protein [Kiritimatiellia bacterium]HOR74010.1 radical SAM protein [Kiritimatiellia bacterium]HPK68963.1 radical SAM protein [Kiritimatiellia bacterium]
MRDCDIGVGHSRVDAMRQRAREEGLPLHATLELTQRCNFRCVHCYVLPNAASPTKELTAGEWLALVKEAADAGCFSVLLTGGEPLLRSDFPEIYLGIRKMGIQVMVFTNASRVDQRIVEVLQEAPPRLIEITIYGASPQTYAAVTGRPEAYLEVMDGVQRLRDAGMPVALKTILMNPNKHDFATIRAMRGAGERQVRYDAAIHARFPGDGEIQQYRVPPAELVELEARHVPELQAEWERTAKREQTQAAKTAAAPGPQPLYTCAAGSISFYATATGMIQPCVSAARYGVQWRPGKLLAAFRQSRQAIQSAFKPAGYACTGCAALPYCASCPAVAELETGIETAVFPYACQVAKTRQRRGVEKELAAKTSLVATPGIS